MISTGQANKRVLVVNGSYREGGVTDQLIALVIEQLDSGGAETEVINLRDYPLEFCLNCRECMQLPGSAPGKCVLDDGMAALVERIEAADAYILAAPTNFGSVSALFKRFMERLAVYGYWPWGQPAPKFRKAGGVAKKALLISSSAAPGLIGRWLYASGKQLRTAAKTIGAKPVGLLFSGMSSQQAQPRLSPRTISAASSMVHKLLSR
ncbi:MAG: flavodoxin family protein [Gammaproteobacteria bacterium]|jgi:NAD(P)H-dependent FMN reductase|nr:flavodoxin family protein [Gammaproteobacteria bacterium]